MQLCRAHNEMICDKIIISIQVDSASEHLQIDPDLKFNNAIRITWQGEILKKQQPTVRMQQQQLEAVPVENIDAKKRPCRERSFNWVPKPSRQWEHEESTAIRMDIVKQCAVLGRPWEQSINTVKMTYFLEQQGQGNVFITGQAKLDTEDYAIKCVGGR